MPTRTATATWNGTLKEGTGTIKVGSGTLEQSYSFETRFEDKPGTTPEELIGGAHAGCFSMALSKTLTDAGHAPEQIRTNANVSLDKSENGFKISTVDLTTKVKASGLKNEEFQKLANEAMEGCPVSKALQGVSISLDAQIE